MELTSEMPAQRQTAEMPVVEIADLLRRDRELDDGPIDPWIGGAAMHVAVARHATQMLACCPAPAQLAEGTGSVLRRSPLRLTLGCAAAFIAGLGLTLPLWW